MDAKFTPGPWKVEKHDGALEVWNQNTFVCSTDSKLFRTAHSQFEDAPNAALIAASPEMYDMLKIISSMHTMKKSQPFMVKEIEDLLKRARGVR